MAKSAIIFGSLLFLLGVVGYFSTGRTSVTALIPSFFGLLILIAGLVGRSERLRPHAMHAAALLGLIGLAGTARAPFQLLSGGEAADDPGSVATPYKAAMALLCLAYVVLSVRSFVAARRARPATAQSEGQA